MKEKNKKIEAIVAIFISVLFFGLSQSAFAQEVTASSTAVTFTVTVGKVLCENGQGKASVSLMNEPLEGGYYEVYGDMITKNNITLNRKVDLPSGTYTWKGFANNGYVISGDSSGTFTVEKCTASPATSQTLKGVEPSSVIKKVENITVEKETLKNTEKNSIKATSSEVSKTTPLALPKVKRTNEIIGGILILAVVLAFFGFRNRTLKQ